MMEESDIRVQEQDVLVEPVRKSNGSFENPFPEFTGIGNGGKFFKFMKERMCGGAPPKPTEVRLLF